MSQTSVPRVERVTSTRRTGDTPLLLRVSSLRLGRNRDRKSCATGPAYVTDVVASPDNEVPCSEGGGRTQVSVACRFTRFTGPRPTLTGSRKRCSGHVVLTATQDGAHGSQRDGVIGAILRLPTLLFRLP